MFKFNLYIIAIGITLFPKVSNADIKLSDEIFRERQTPERDKRLSIELFKNKYFFSSLAFAKNYIAEINKIDPKFEIILEKLIIKTGTISFSYMQEKVLIKHQQTPSMALAYGLRLGQKKKWGRALGVLKNIPNNHRFSSEARLMEGAAYNILNKDLEAEQAYQQCHKMAKVLENASEAKRQKRYYSILKESCAINLARLEYKNANYDKAMDLYNSVPKTSFRWPFMLIEKAWTAYKQEDYNRSLGIIVTYKSPLLSSYFLPEAEVLSSLSYYKLCLYQDSLKIIEQYYNVYRKRSNALRELLIRHKISHTFFLKMMFAPISKVEKINPYIRNLLTQIRKKIKFSIDLVAYKRVQNELKVVQKLSKLELTSLLENELKESLRWRTIHFNRKYL